VPEQPHSVLAGLNLDTAIRLRWALRDIKAKRTKLSPVSPDDLTALIELGLVEMRDGAPISHAKNAIASLPPERQIVDRR
jgi:hypothetical protein